MARTEAVNLNEPLNRNNWVKIKRFLGGLPVRCVLCGAPALSEPLCAGCVEDLPWRRHMRLPTVAGVECHASFRYDFPLIEFIGRGKLGGEPGLMRLLGRLMATRPAVAPDRFDAICAVPLPYWRSVSRGFNQAREIARPLAAQLGLPLLETLVRDGGGPTQRGLGRAARLRNPSGRFRGLPSVAGKRLLLIDDVLTTGTTLREAARVLRAAGAETVVAWSASAVDRGA
jgi:ComF family protein